MPGSAPLTAGRREPTFAVAAVCGDPGMGGQENIDHESGGKADRAEFKGLFADGS